jgi:hypothetical protein
MLIVVFWVVTQCTNILEEHITSIFKAVGLLSCNAENGYSMFLQNAGNGPQVHMALQPRKPTLP